MITSCSMPAPAPAPIAPPPMPPPPPAQIEDRDAGTIAAQDAEVMKPELDAGMIATPEKSLGIAVIDVQETFVRGAVNRDLPDILLNTRTTFELARDHQLPLLITFEDSKSGDHALTVSLRPHVPAGARELVKTKFDATELPAFREAVQASERSHWAVLGSETDVCVLQTVLGLRALGYTVLLAKNAVLSSEPNTSPALRRMQQAGVVLVELSELRAMTENVSLLPDPAGGAELRVRQTRPLELAVVLDSLTDETLSRAGNNDPLYSQKAARVRELLLVSQWFELPVFIAGGGELDVPREFAGLFEGELLPVSMLAQRPQIKQLVFAGTDENLTETLTAASSSHELFLMEDALFTLGGTVELDPMIAGALVPTTYKSFYYDMIKSVNDREWPKTRWVERAEIYFDLTRAPEDLPAMPFTP